MKKFLVILVALIGLGIGANANSKSCKISGTQNGTVVASVSHVDYETGDVTIDWSNDSDVHVNITILITGTAAHGGGAQTEQTFLASPNTGNSKIFRLGQKLSTSREVKIAQLSGAKCN